MRSFKVLIVTIFCFFSFGEAVFSQVRTKSYQCPDFQLEVTSKSPGTNRADGEIEVECNACVGKIRFLFANAERTPINAKELNSKIDKLTAGVYYCFVVNENGCSKEIKIDLK